MANVPTQQVVSFQPHQTSAVGAIPTAVTSAYVNGDGKVDLVVANAGFGASPSTVSVLLGNGNGTFGAPSDFGVDGGPYSVTVADVIGDGALDIVTSNITSGTVSVLRGNGNGTFSTKSDFSFGGSLFSATSADVDRDGKLDLVVADYDFARVRVLLGNGDTFFIRPNLAVGSGPRSVTSADVNKDGKVDVVTANAGSGTVSVLLGNGNGTFEMGRDFAVGNAPFAVTSADLNGDGNPDIVTANLSDNTVSVLLGNGDGTFRTQRTSSVPGGPNSVTIADIDGDGTPDIVTANRYNATVSVLLGNGDGTFQTQQAFTVGGVPTSVTSADLNRDGKPDIVTANSGDNTISVLLNATIRAQVYTLALTPSSGPEGTPPGAGTTYTVTVSRTGDASAAGTVSLGFTGTATPPGGTGADYTVASGTGTYFPGEGQTGASFTLGAGISSATFTITTIPDSIVEPNETATITLTGVTAGGGKLGTTTSATLTILDDDGATTGGGGGGGGGTGTGGGTTTDGSGTGGSGTGGGGIGSSGGRFSNRALFGTVVYDPASPIGGVYALYLALLGRAPDPLGLESFATALETGASLADVAATLLASPERGATAQSTTAFVQSLYTRLLGREPDADGLRAAANALNAGMTPAQLAVQLATSPEARARIAPAFQEGVFVPDASEGSVARLFYGLLGRTPDAGGLTAYAAFIENGGGGAAGEAARLGQVAAALIGSPEYARSHSDSSDAAFITGLYQAALGRAPDPGGAVTWLTALSRGVSRASVALGIAEGPEAQLYLAGQIEIGAFVTA